MHKPADTPRPLARDNKSDAPTPMIAQYIEIKAANPDCLLFYRMGDFYELFFEDSLIASRALGIMARVAPGKVELTYSDEFDLAELAQRLESIEL